MRVDWYSKGVLTVIALLLGAIVARDYVGPVGVQAQSGGFAGVQYSVSGYQHSFFDPRTGDIWMYGGLPPGTPPGHYRVTRPGALMVEVK